METHDLYDKIGSSRIGLGCMRLPTLNEKEARRLIETALENGITLFDHADIYAAGEAESLFGRSINSKLREQMVLQSKYSIRPGICYDLSKEHILRSVDESLRRLQTEYLDVLLLHRPDLLYEPEEVASAFDKLYQSFEYFEKLYDLLKLYKVNDYISFELGLMSQHEYYTGVIFSGYTYGSGEPIVKGGSYDNLLSYFGKDAFAIGFAVFVDGLQMAVDNQKIPVYVEHKGDVILYRKENRELAIEKAKVYRDYGKVVQMIRFSDEEELKRLKELFSDDYIEVIGEE